MSAPILDVRNLCTECAGPEGKRAILQRVSFSLQSQEVLAVVGESGCGKSMTLQSILQMPITGVRQTSGSVRLDGRELTALNQRELTRLRGQEISMVFQNPVRSLDPTMPIGKQLAGAVLAHRAVPRGQLRQMVLKAMQEAGFDEPEQMVRRYPHTLSGGQCQRVMIAMAIVLSPKVLLADEPTTSLDAIIQHDILRLLVDLKRHRNMAMLFVSHNLQAVSIVADRIAVMYAGSIVETGSADQILHDSLHPYTRNLLAAIPTASLAPRTPFPIAHARLREASGSEGCPYAYHCPKAMNICLRRTPERVDVVPGHSVVCWLPAESRSPKGETSCRCRSSGLKA